MTVLRNFTINTPVDNVTPKESIVILIYNGTILDREVFLEIDSSDPRVSFVGGNTVISGIELEENTLFRFSYQARDVAGNLSDFSDIVEYSTGTIGPLGTVTLDGVIVFSGFANDTVTLDGVIVKIF